MRNLEFADRRKGPRRLIWLLLIGLILHALIWQFAEGRMLSFGEKLMAWVSGKPFNQTPTFDAAGVPIQIYREQGLQYNPLFIAVQANEDFTELGDPKKRERFILLTNWLIEHADVSDSLLYMTYHFDWPDFELYAPWHSALTQAVVMTTFFHRYEIEQDSLWLSYSRMAFNTLKPPSKLVKRLSDDAIWFMEYPSESCPFAMGGMISVMLNLHKYHQNTGDAEAYELFNQAYAGLLQKIAEFDYYGFSLYSTDGPKTGRSYHQLYIHRLEQISAIRSHPKLDYYRKRWQIRDRYPVVLQLFFNPRPLRVLAFVLSFLMLEALFWGIWHLRR